MVLDTVFRREPRLVALDVAESLALLAFPALLFGLGAALLGGFEAFTDGARAGGWIGLVLALVRVRLHAVRTDDGIRRRLPTYDDDPETNPWARVAHWEYDEKYDRLLVLLLVAVGAGAFAAVAVGGTLDESTLWLVVVGSLSWTAALVTIGVRSA